MKPRVKERCWRPECGRFAALVPSLKWQNKIQRARTTGEEHDGVGCRSAAWRDVVVAKALRQISTKVERLQKVLSFVHEKLTSQKLTIQAG